MDNKELYEAISEIRKDMSSVKEETAKTGAQMDFLLDNYRKMDDYNKRLTEVEASADRSLKRHDSADKWRFALGTGVIGAIITSILNLIMNN